LAGDRLALSGCFDFEPGCSGRLAKVVTRFDVLLLIGGLSVNGAYYHILTPNCQILLI
jgi:hypothetical protein